MILASNGKDLDAIVAFSKMRVKPVVFDVPVLVLCHELGRIGGCNIMSSLVVFKCMTDERNMVAGDLECGSNFLEDMAKRNKSAHSRSEGQVFCFCSQCGDFGL